MNKLMRNDLRHDRGWCNNIEKFFQHIDETGGWPVGFEYVGFEHTDERMAGFTDYPLRSGYWTTICHADEYYTWKLSPKGKAKIAKKAAEAIRSLTRMDLEKLYTNKEGKK